jgi:hypothetical protein
MAVRPCEQLFHWTKVDGFDNFYVVTREVLVGARLVQRWT